VASRVLMHCPVRVPVALQLRIVRGLLFVCMRCLLVMWRCARVWVLKCGTKMTLAAVVCCVGLCGWEGIFVCAVCRRRYTDSLSLSLSRTEWWVCVPSLPRCVQAVRQNAAADPDAPPVDLKSLFPPELRRRYEVRFTARSKTPTRAVREIGASQIGSLVVVKGIVTRITDVKPLVSVATYTCDACGFEAYQEVAADSFMPVVACPSEKCKGNQKLGTLSMQTRGSKFTKYQEMRLQELAEQVPIGNVPRTMTVKLRGEMTRKASPGDVVTISGIFLPVQSHGFAAIRKGLISDTFIHAMSLDKEKKSYADVEVDEAMLEKIEEAAQRPNIYSALAQSLAPEIWGHEDVKKALLLVLVAGVTRSLREEMSIRGDINVCLMGDPGVAKSQLLKYIAHVAPRGVYTSGKGSSGVGLTAAVLVDPVTGELTLEGGALVLADKGICCIDEFDKMEEADRTAIHEVMEQQTVSVAKAGITTTLNARTAIIAAANPLYGRYNVHKSAEENINLPTALLSRFDLLFLLLDRHDERNDKRLAEHICHVHRESRAPELDIEVYPASFVRAFISQARRFDPVIPRNLSNFIVESYVGMRAHDKEAETPSSGYTGARTLLAIIRLSQALARLRFSDEVVMEDVEEAMRLIQVSRETLHLETDVRGGRKADPKSALFNIIHSVCERSGRRKTDYSAILRAATAQGHSESFLQSVLEEYSQLNVIIYKKNNYVQFVNAAGA
jgi:DNA replication licensing factor MCM7